MRSNSQKTVPRMPDSSVSVNYRGELQYFFPIVETIGCDLHILYFPFDEHICEINITANVLPKHIQSLERDPDRDEKALEDYFSNSEWGLVSFEAIENDEIGRFMICSDCVFDILTFRLKIRRRWVFHFTIYYMPNLFLNLKTVFQFLLPCDSAERVKWGSSTYLGVTFYLLIVRNIFSQSIELPIWVMYIALTAFLTGLSQIITIYMLYFHFHGTHDNFRTLPSWGRSLVLHRMAGWLGMKKLIYPDDLRNFLMQGHTSNISLSADELEEHLPERPQQLGDIPELTIKEEDFVNGQHDYNTQPEPSASDHSDSSLDNKPNVNGNYKQELKLAVVRKSVLKSGLQRSETSRNNSVLISSTDLGNNQAKQLLGALHKGKSPKTYGIPLKSKRQGSIFSVEATKQTFSDAEFSKLDEENQNELQGGNSKTTSLSSENIAGVQKIPSNESIPENTSSTYYFDEDDHDQASGKNESNNKNNLGNETNDTEDEEKSSSHDEHDLHAENVQYPEDDKASYRKMSSFSRMVSIVNNKVNRVKSIYLSTMKHRLTVQALGNDEITNIEARLHTLKKSIAANTEGGKGKDDMTLFKILKHVELADERTVEQLRIRVLRDEWKQFAMVLDRCSLIIYIVLTVLLWLYILLQTPVYHDPIRK